jgi:adenylate kinase family enzyme
MEQRIGIVGSPGTGKSILAQILAHKLNIPFLASKDITGDILSRDGYDFASGIQVEKFLATDARQIEILRRTREQQSISNFVTDRTAIDIAAYAILEMQGAYNVKKHLEVCKTLASMYTHLFFCSWVEKEIEDNKKRTLDPWYQFSVHSVELEVCKLFNVSLFVLNFVETDKRVEQILQHLNQ